jgi:hypothetical protein
MFEGSNLKVEAWEGMLVMRKFLDSNTLLQVWESESKHSPFWKLESCGVSNILNKNANIKWYPN